MRKLALALLLSGCVHHADFGSRGRIDDPQALLEAVKARYAAVSGLAGEGKIAADTPGLRGQLKMAVEAQEPGSLYLETADFLGTVRGIFVTDGQNYAFYRVDENTYDSGPATAEAIGRYLPLSLSPRELVQALLGEPPILEADSSHLELDEATDAYVLTLRKEGLLQRLRIGTRDQRLISVENRGRASYDAFFEDHRLLGSVLFPATIRLRVPKARAEVLLHYTDLRLNPVSSPSTFQLPPPPGARRQDTGDPQPAVPAPGGSLP